MLRSWWKSIGTGLSPWDHVLDASMWLASRPVARVPVEDAPTLFWSWLWLLRDTPVPVVRE
eukprot:12046327-Prorocentrum_lima.AAC.1